jgi:hypothetical protein
MPNKIGGPNVAHTVSKAVNTVKKQFGKIGGKDAKIGKSGEEDGVTAKRAGSYKLGGEARLRAKEATQKAGDGLTKAARRTGNALDRAGKKVKHGAKQVGRDLGKGLRKLKDLPGDVIANARNHTHNSEADKALNDLGSSQNPSVADLKKIDPTEVPSNEDLELSAEAKLMHAGVDVEKRFKQIKNDTAYAPLRKHFTEFELVKVDLYISGDWKKTDDKELRNNILSTVEKVQSNLYSNPAGQKLKAKIAEATAFELRSTEAKNVKATEEQLEEVLGKPQPVIGHNPIDRGVQDSRLYAELRAFGHELGLTPRNLTEVITAISRSPELSKLFSQGHISPGDALALAASLSKAYKGSSMPIIPGKTSVGSKEDLASKINAMVKKLDDNNVLPMKLTDLRRKLYG